MLPRRIDPQGVGKPLPDDPLELVVGESIRLPGFPDILLRLDRELKREDVNVSRVAGLVRMDPVVSGQILRLANSSWYDRGGKPVQDLTRAVIRLGLPLTRDLVRALILPSLFGNGGGVLDSNRYWRHSFAVALLSQSLGRLQNLSREQMDLLWVAGILHDVGALLCDLLAAEKLRLYMAYLAGAKGGESRRGREQEKTILGAELAELGGTFLLRTWKLPEGIVRMIRFHDDPDRLESEADIYRPALCVHVAEILCEARGVDWMPGPGRSLDEAGAMLRKMGLGSEDVAAIAEEVDQVIRSANEMLGSAKK